MRIEKHKEKNLYIFLGGNGVHQIQGQMQWNPDQAQKLIIMFTPTPLKEKESQIIILWFSNNHNDVDW